jgi:hypothetical protein
MFTKHVSTVHTVHRMEPTIPCFDNVKGGYIVFVDKLLGGVL